MYTLAPKMYILTPKMDKSLPFEKVQPQFCTLFSESVVLQDYKHFIEFYLYLSLKFSFTMDFIQFIHFQTFAQFCVCVNIVDEPFLIWSINSPLLILQNAPFLFHCTDL